jgi:hypothetical protein
MTGSDAVAALAGRVQRGVIRIETTTCTGTEIGTGFLVGHRLIATVEHVVDGATSITLKRNGQVVGLGTVIGEDPTRDVALVQSSAPISGPVLTLAPRSPRLGESVEALGFPLGLPLTVTQGDVSGLDRTVPINGIERTNLVQTDAAVNPGNSGGPLVSIDTHAVVGLVDLGAEGVNGISFAVSAQVAQPLLQAWADSPQPAPVTGCTTTSSSAATTTSTATTASSTATTASGTAPANTVPTYYGNAFSIEYPIGWGVQAAEQPTSYGTDTLIAPPGQSSTIHIRIDVSPNPPTTDLRALAQPEIDALARQPGYSLIDLSDTSVDGYPALHWEFDVDQDGVLLQKEDDFFIDSATGEGVAILTEAPASQYSAYYADVYTALRNTLTMN